MRYNANFNRKANFVATTKSIKTAPQSQDFKISAAMYAQMVPMNAFESRVFLKQASAYASGCRKSTSDWAAFRLKCKAGTK
jgi:hypothetical protein